MFRRLVERERELEGRYKGWRSALHVVRADYAVLFILWVVGIVLCLAYLTANPGARMVYDDSYITLKFAQNLRQSGRFMFQTEEQAQASPGSGANAGSGLGMTSPLHVVLVTLFSFVTRRIEYAALLVGILSLVLAVSFAYYWSKTVTGSRRIGAIAALLFVTSGWMVFDALSGLETVLFIALLLLALFLYEKNWLWFGIPLGLAAMTRPDAWFFAAGLLAYGLIRFAYDRDVKRLARLGLGFGLLLLSTFPYLLLQARHSGSLLPNTALTKAFFSGETGLPLSARPGLFLPGIKLFYANLVMPLPFLVPLGLILARRFYRSYYVLLAGLFFYAAYLMMFPGALSSYWCRYQHIFLPFLNLAIAEAGYNLTSDLQPSSGPGSRDPFGSWRSWRLGGSSSCLLGLLLLNQFGSLVERRTTYAEAVKSIERVNEDVARFVREHSVPGEFAAAHDIGTLAFFSQRPVLDLVGLVSPGPGSRVPGPGSPGRPIPPRERDVLPYLLQHRPRFLVISEDTKRLLNLDPDKLTDNFVFLGESGPIYPNKSGGYRIYGTIWE